MLILFARDPFPDVRRTVAKRYAVAFARAQEPNSVPIHEDDVLEIQHEGPARRFRGEQRGEFADVVGSESTAQGRRRRRHLPCAGFSASILDATRKAIARPAEMLNLKRLGWVTIGEISPIGEIPDNNTSRTSSSRVARESGSC